MILGQTSQSIDEDPAITPQDVLSRLEAAAVLRDHLVTALGRVLLLCLEDDTRVPFERVHDVVRTRQVAVYDLLQILPVLRNKIPRQQLYKLLQMLERIGSRFVSEYASLCIGAFSDIDMERAQLTDILSNIDEALIESISRDKHRTGEIPVSLTEGIDFLLRAARNDSRILNLRTVSAMLLNYPSFDLTDPVVPGAIRFVAQRMRERSRSEDPLLQYMGPNLENTPDFLRTVLERLEVDERSSDATKEAISLLLQNIDVPSYPPAPGWKNDPRKLLMITSDRYPDHVVAVAKYLASNLDDSDFRDLDIGFYETGDHALLQVLSHLRGKPKLRHAGKALSLLMSFVSQKLAHEADYDYTMPVSYHEVNGYIDSFDTPCLQQDTSRAMKTLRPHLSEDLPWTYAFGDRQSCDNPWELIMNSLIRLRNVPLNKARANAIDNFIYKARVNALTGERGLLYDSGLIFQRDDSTSVELDFYSLLMRIPNAFKSEKFAPMLNFLSKPNILDILGCEFNKFEHETPRSLLLALLRRALTLPLIKSDLPLSRALQNAHSYLEEPLLANLYTSQDLQLLLQNLPGIDSDPRYLALKILFRKHKLFAYLSPTFSIAGLRTSMERLALILQMVSLKVTQPRLSEALSFALDSIDGPPLPARPFDHDDFVYLVKQLLPRNGALRDEILLSPVYANISNWNISMSGTAENVLARALSYPVDSIANDAHLSYIVRRTESIMGEKKLVDIELLKKRTLESMMEYLPNSTYVKPVNLLLRKANLMTLVPRLNLETLENATARDALIALLRNLTESRVIRAEKLLLRRVRAALSSLDGASGDDRQTSIFVYLIQSLQDPSNVAYKPLLQETKKLRNVTVPSEERENWLRRYLREIATEGKTAELKKAALMALEDIMYDESMNEEAKTGKARIKKAVSFLPVDSAAEPLRKLLTPDWVYTILPEELRNANFSEKEDLLLAILYYAKQRADVANNPALMRTIAKIEMSLNGWRTNVEPLRNTVTAIKAAVYDPVKNLFTATGLNKIRVAVPTERSAKVSLLGLLHSLLLHPLIKNNSKVWSLLSTVRQDVFAFGVDVDLLTVLDDVGIAYTSELAPIRLFLYRRDIGEKFGRTVFAVVQPKERYRSLLKLLEEQRQLDNDTRFLDALSTLKRIQPTEGEFAGTLFSDLSDIVNVIPQHIRQQFKSIEHLFNANVLSRLTSDNEIVESKTPMITLLSKMADLPEIRDNNSVASTLKSMRYEVEQSGDRPIVTGFQLRPLLLELRHVQQINIDFLYYILDPEVLSYLNSEEFSDMSDDNAEILRTIIDYFLNEGPAYGDSNMRRHLQSFKRALVLMMGSATVSKSQLTKEDWEQMLALIPRKKDFAPVRIFLQSKEINKYIPEDTNWKSYSTPAKKMLYLLSLMEEGDVENKNVYESASKLRENLEERFNFVTQVDVKDMRRTLVSLKLRYDLVPLKIFLNHDNMIKYLPPDFKYTEYGESNHALAAVLDNLLRVPSLRRRATLHKTMIFVKQSLLEQSSTRRSYRKSSVPTRLSSEDIEFVNLLNMSLPKLREFMNPQKLVSLLPESFNFRNRPTFKTKTLHLLRQLLQLNTDVRAELEGLLREVEAYPDVPDITMDDLTPILKIIPFEGIPHVELIKKYLKPTTLIKLLPGNFDIKRSPNAKVALHDILLFLSVTLGPTKSDELKMAINALIGELTKISSNLIPEEAVVDNNDVRSIINEIPFKQFKQIEQLEAEMMTAKVVSSLSLNFQLAKYKTKKLRLLAILDELSKSDTFRSSLDSISFVRRIVSKMPDVPKVNDTEIEKLLSPLPLNTFYVRHLVANCKMDALAPYLPIHFDLGSIETRKRKVAKILQYCKLANPKDVSTRQALTNAEALLEGLSDFDITREHVEVLIGAIPCTHFTSLKPLLRFLAKVDVASLLPWDLDLYKARTFKLRVFDLLTALRNVKELQNDQMFSALDSLETNAKSLPDEVTVPQDRVANLKAVTGIDDKSCEEYREFVTKPENLIKILPPTYSFQPERSLYSEWSFVIYFSTLFLRDAKVDGPVRNAFEAARNIIRTAGRSSLVNGMRDGLEQEPFKQLVPLRLYTLGHADTLSAPIENVYRGFLHGSPHTLTRVAMKQFIHMPEITRSKSLVDDAEVFLHDYAIVRLRDSPSRYEINEAIREITSDDNRYDDLRLLMRCRDIQTPIMERSISADGTSKQLLLDMLEVAEGGDIDEEIRQKIASVKPNLERDVREEEVEYVLKQMRDYRYHESKIEPIRSYLAQHGLQKILGDDYRAQYPTFKERLVAINDTLAASAELTSELHAASDYLRKVLNNEIKIRHIIPRTMDDINVQTLFFALPKTRDERIIRGIIRFFSAPNLLRSLNLPKDPFEYVTKGRLLQVILDLGQELQSVQEDPVQQEALEYFRDKVITTGPGAQPIELKKYAQTSNVNVDMYGVMRAIDYSKADESVAVKVALFFERKYDNLVHAVGFDHMAYATRGAYLKALFEHLVNVSQVSDEVKQQITLLTPTVRLDGPGDEAIDLNDDFAPGMRMLDGFPGMSYGRQDSKSRSFRPIARFGDTTELPYTFRENRESLKAAVHDMLESITSSEEEYLDRINGKSKDDYDSKTRVIIGVPQHAHETARRRSSNSRRTIEHRAQPRMRIAIDDSGSALEKARSNGRLNEIDAVRSNLTKTSATDRAKIRKRDRSAEGSSGGDINISTEDRIKYKVIRKTTHSKLKNDLSPEAKSDFLGDHSSDVDGDSSVTSDKRIVERLPATSQDLPKTLRRNHRKRYKLMARKFLLRPDTSIDIEYDDESNDENAPVVRMFRDILQSDEESLSLTKELLAEQARNISEKTKTVKKDLSSRHMRKKKDTEQTRTRRIHIN